TATFPYTPPTINQNTDSRTSESTTTGPTVNLSSSNYIQDLENENFRLKVGLGLGLGAPLLDRSTAEKTYWRCIKFLTYHCHSRLHICIITNNIIKQPTEHTCRFDDATLELCKFDQQLADCARNTQEPPEIIIINCIRNMSDGGLTRLLCRDNIKRRIRKLRHNNDFTTAPNDSHFISISIML
ncbi:unnamed protein product, partial [Rotaria sordida]